MTPSDLTAAHFRNYPPQARALASAHLVLLRHLPLAFLPSLLRELIEYDYKFPVERMKINRELDYLESLPPADLANCFDAFSRIRFTEEQTSFNWYGRPIDFTEQLSAYLWRTHQINAFHDAAISYGDRLQRALGSPALPVPRLGIAVIGQGATPPQPRLFQKLREHGTFFTNIDPAGGLSALLAAVEARAQKHPVPYAHWYIDGGLPLGHSGAITEIAYGKLAATRKLLFEQIQKQVSKPGTGPEELRDHLTHLSPSELDLKQESPLDHFQVKVLTEGSGTQIFSTTFAQWAAREALRRAEPLTLLVRFAPRQRQRPMNELLAGDETTPQLDPAGSLIDGDMAAYYHWINQQRLPQAEQSSFLVWFEDQRQAFAISPTLPHGTESQSSLSMPALLSLVTG